MRIGGHASSRWQQASGWVIIFLLFGTTAVIALQPDGTDAYTLGSASRHALNQSANHLESTPGPASAAITPTPDQGPVKTLVKLQGSGWPSGSQVLISYDSDASCTGPNLTELSPDPKPTVSSTGTFTASFSWPTVSATGFWYICAATAAGDAAGSAAFDVLSLSPPSLTILTKGPFTLGKAITVQGQNWLPGGFYIAFSFRPVGANTSYFLDEYAISLQNGTFSATTITIPSYLPPGRYVLVATMEQQALAAHSSTITIAATPTPTPTATPSPSPSPIITLTPTRTINPGSGAAPHRPGGTLLALIIISGSMALAFALIGTALLIYLRRSRPIPQAPFALEPYDGSND
jgi:hypothetical protein